MPTLKRHATKFPGVYFIEGTSVKGNPEKIFYIRYRKKGKAVDEKAGREERDDMTAARAATLRARKIEGDAISNEEKRDQARKEKEAEKAVKWTFINLWEKYTEDNYGLKSRQADASRFKNWIKPTLGDREPKDLFPLDLDRLRLRTMKDKSPQTIKLVLEQIKRISRFGVRKRLCEPIPFAIEMPKVDNLKTEDLTEDQLTTLLKAIDESEHKQAGDMMKLALFSGMRRSEMLKLRWEDVDFGRCFINIREPKGVKSQKIPLNDGARHVLLSLPREEGNPYVFPGRGGDRRKDPHRATRAIADKAGLPKTFRPLHGLRHTYASMLASSGKVDLYTLQKLLTHKDPKMTQRYAHLRDEALRKASDVAGDIISLAMNGAKAKAEG